MLRRAGRAVAAPAALNQPGRRAAIRAEPVPRVPMQHRLRLGDRREMLGPDQPLHRERSQIGDEEIGLGLERIGLSGIDPDTEPPGVSDGPEEHRFLWRGQ